MPLKERKSLYWNAHCYPLNTFELQHRTLALACSLFGIFSEFLVIIQVIFSFPVNQKPDTPSPSFSEYSTYYNLNWKQSNCSRPRATANLDITVTASGSLPWIWSASMKVDEVWCQKIHRNRTFYTLPAKIVS